MTVTATPPRMGTREDLINHIIDLRLENPEYARFALDEYDRDYPHLTLKAGVLDAWKKRNEAKGQP